MKNRRRQNRGWNHATEWYSGWVGEKGSYYHRKYGVPTVLRMMKLKKNDKVLDIGCGTGILAYYVKKEGGEYTGIDVSENMIIEAKKLQGRNGDFFKKDITLDNLAPLKPNSQDFAVFLFSVQDIPDLEKAVKNTVSLLKDKGTVIIFMLHPAFRIPRQTGWVFDEKRKITSRRVDRYLSSSEIPLQQKISGKNVKTIFYHRPLTDYFKIFNRYGLLTESLIEVSTSDKGGKYSRGNQEGNDKEFPHFIAMKLTKG